jgi:two-component system sensor histidine kinase AgrC
LGFSLFADYNLTRLYNAQFTIYNFPELTILVLFFIFFLFHLIHLKNLHANIAKTLEAEFELELAEKELELRQIHADRLEKELEVQELYNTTLKGVLDELKLFKHEFSNIINKINGFVRLKDLSEMEKYMSTLATTTISSATMEIVENLKNSPALYGLIVAKISYAREHNIEFPVTIMCENPDTKYCSTLDYGLIVGTLLDNAFRAASRCGERFVQFDMMVKNGKFITTIVNVCTEEVDMSRIFERGYSTKPSHSSGEGLYQVKRILDKYNVNDWGMQLVTTLENGMFKQELII